MSVARDEWRSAPLVAAPSQSSMLAMERAPIPSSECGNLSPHARQAQVAAILKRLSVEDMNAFPVSRRKLNELLLFWLSNPATVAKVSSLTDTYAANIFPLEKRPMPNFFAHYKDPRSRGDHRVVPSSTLDPGFSPRSPPQSPSRSFSPSHSDGVDDSPDEAESYVVDISHQPGHEGRVGRESRTLVNKSRSRSRSGSSNDRSPSSPAARSVAGTYRETSLRSLVASIPMFYFPKTLDCAPEVVAVETALLRDEIKALTGSVEDAQLSADHLAVILQKVLHMPSFLSTTLIARIIVAFPSYTSGVSGNSRMTSSTNTSSTEPSYVGAKAAKISGAMFIDFFAEFLCRHSPDNRLLHILRGRGAGRAAGPAGDYLVRDDFSLLMMEVTERHQGLEFLKATPEFQDRYAETVIERTYYALDTRDCGRLYYRDIENGRLLDVLLSLDSEVDINSIADFFPYEHFYVIYCKFWELDEDHDFMLCREDLLRYSNHALSARVVDRIFDQAPRRFVQQQRGDGGDDGGGCKMGYSDFIWFILSEEDKTTPAAQKYWFRVLDLMSDSVLNMTELEYFFLEQQNRMETLGIEPVKFCDILCQVTDLVKPAKDWAITMNDIRRSQMAPVFFNGFVSLPKFLAYEHRDPFLWHSECEGWSGSDWERFAADEYSRLVEEDAE